MRRHKVILEVEVYVEDDEKPESCADFVVDSIKGYIGHGGTSGSFVAGAHGRSRMDPEDCVECNRNARYVVEGIHKRDVM